MAKRKTFLGGMLAPQNSLYPSAPKTDALLQDFRATGQKILANRKYLNQQSATPSSSGISAIPAYGVIGAAALAGAAAITTQSKRLSQDHIALNKSLLNRDFKAEARLYKIRKTRMK